MHQNYHELVLPSYALKYLAMLRFALPFFELTPYITQNEQKVNYQMANKQK